MLRSDVLSALVWPEILNGTTHRLLGCRDQDLILASAPQSSQGQAVCRCPVDARLLFGDFKCVMEAKEERTGWKIQLENMSK